MPLETAQTAECVPSSPPAHRETFLGDLLLAPSPSHCSSIIAEQDEDTAQQ